MELKNNTTRMFNIMQLFSIILKIPDIYIEHLLCARYYNTRVPEFSD